MGVMRIDHPDVELFINAKHPTQETAVLWDMVEEMEDPARKAVAAKALQQTLPLTAFNMSLAVTDEFASDRQLLAKIMEPLADFDLFEPFGRIREAIEEAGRGNR